jgi:hypothetical protein
MTDTTNNPIPDTPGSQVPDPWGYYYLRYFVGAIIGAGLLVLLWTAKAHALFPSQKFSVRPHEWLGLAVTMAALGTAGLAYCYVASAPILLLHGFRHRLTRNNRVWGYFRVLLAVVTTVLLVLVLFCPWKRATPFGVLNHGFGRLMFNAPYTIVMIAQAFSLFLVNLPELRESYYKLTDQRARGRDEDSVREYVESYRHLREHGNALLIIIMEVVLSAAIYAAGNLLRVIGIMVIWILPATFAWFLGTWLEFDFPTASSQLSTRATSQSPAKHVIEVKAEIALTSSAPDKKDHPTVVVGARSTTDTSEGHKS